jgi:hypothetical protein
MARRRITTADQLVDALGGTRALAQRFGYADCTVSGWRVRGFPLHHRAALRRLAREARIAADPALFEIRVPAHYRRGVLEGEAMPPG